MRDSWRFSVDQIIRTGYSSSAFQNLSKARAKGCVPLDDPDQDQFITMATSVSPFLRSCDVLRRGYSLEQFCLSFSNSGRTEYTEFQFPKEHNSSFST